MINLNTLITGLMIFVSGCAVSYTSRYKLKEPFLYKTKILVNIICGDPFTGSSNTKLVHGLEKALRKDLTDNVFPNVVTTDNGNITVKVIVWKLSSDWLTGGGSATISLTIIFSDKVIIKKYENSDSTGLQITTVDGIIGAVKKAMEGIKKMINRDRNEIVSAIEHREILNKQRKQSCYLQDHYFIN